MADVFISYLRSDQAMVATLGRAVEAARDDVSRDAELRPHLSLGEIERRDIERIGQAEARYR